MGILPGGKTIIEEIIPIRNIEATTCKEKLKGAIDEHGNCLIRIRVDPSNPNKTELLKIGYVGPSPPTAAASVL